MACIINKNGKPTLVEAKAEFLNDEVRARRHINNFYDGGMVIDFVEVKTGDVIQTVYFTTYEAGNIQGILD